MIKAIETRYAGCHFRSRLEARWAVFFDTLGIPWEYEPQGFEWDANTITGARWIDDDDTGILGGRYLPDFWLPSIETWFEVKGAVYSSEDGRLHFEFAVVTGQRHITAVGDIPDPNNPGSYDTDSMYLNGGCDFNYWWCVCPWCGKPGIEFNGRGARVCPGIGPHDCVGPCTADCTIKAAHNFAGRPDDKAYTYDDPKILHAYTTARSARFEHGQSGAT